MTAEQQAYEIRMIIDMLRKRRGGPLKEWRELDIKAMEKKLEELDERQSAARNKNRS